MKTKYLFILLLVSNSLFACTKRNNVSVSEPTSNGQDISTQNYKMKITIGSKTFTATLIDNATGRAFKAMLPTTLKMDDLNSNEKKYDFPKTLPGQSVNPVKINIGDLMIWSGNTLVLFYKSFSTPYSYAKLGQIDDPSGLANALGAGSVTVVCESGN